MPIENIHTSLVYLNKSVEDAAAVVGSEVPHTGDMFALLNGVYEKAEQECTIGIAFTGGDGGVQVNEYAARYW